MEREYFAREGQRYVHVSPGAIYESQLQQLIGRNAGALFSGYVGVLLEPLLQTPAGDVKPDLVLVRPDGSGWALVEVEVEGHSFSSHILPQVTKLTFAESSAKLADQLVHLLPSIPSAKIRTSLAFRPEVFLVMQGTSRKEEERLRKLSIEVLDVEVLKAPDKPNEYALRVVDRTIRLRELSVEATRDTSPMTRNFFRIADLSLQNLLTVDGKIAVQVRGTWAEWPATLQSDEILLRQPSGISIPEHDVDSINRARVFVDDENAIVFLEPAGGK